MREMNPGLGPLKGNHQLDGFKFQGFIPTHSLLSTSKLWVTVFREVDSIPVDLQLVMFAGWSSLVSTAAV